MFILDASVIISFYREMGIPDTLHVLVKHGHKLIIPSRVYAEIKGDSFSILLEAIETGKIILCSKVSSEECNNLKIKHPPLSNGEIEVILLGLELVTQTSCVCVLDDKKARAVATSYGLNVIGTSDLLNKMLNKDIITKEQRDKLIKVLQGATFRR